MSQTCQYNGTQHPSTSITSNCHPCDHFSWCWSGETSVVNSNCRGCDTVTTCHPEGVEADASCLECDDYLICHAAKAQDGRSQCLHHPHTCSCQ